MSTNAYVLKPSFSPNTKSGELVALLGIIPMRYAPPEKIERFILTEAGRALTKHDDKDDLLVLQRVIEARSLNQIDTEAWMFAAELQLAFAAPEMHVY